MERWRQKKEDLTVYPRQPVGYIVRLCKIQRERERETTLRVLVQL
jgi:hypothetical protein